MLDITALTATTPVHAPSGEETEDDQLDSDEVRALKARRRCFHTQGEIMALISAHVLQAPSNRRQVIYSDHQNSVRLLSDHNSNLGTATKLIGMNGRSYYQWLFSVNERTRADVIYTQGHSATTTISSLLNNKADHYATQAQKYLPLVPRAPTPTFFMDDFTPYREIDGWIESNIRSFVDMSLARQTSSLLPTRYGSRHSLHLYDRTSPPEHPYTHATSAYSALIQLYACSGQLPTAHLMASRSHITSGLCRLCHYAIEDMQHIFVDCHHFNSLRIEATQAVIAQTEQRLADSKIKEAVQSSLMSKAKSIFVDHAVWPLRVSRYYLGQLPGPQQTTSSQWLEYTPGVSLVGENRSTLNKVQTSTQRDERQPTPQRLEYALHWAENRQGLAHERLEYAPSAGLLAENHYGTALKRLKA
jgi:hypothetical protein